MNAKIEIVLLLALYFIDGALCRRNELQHIHEPIPWNKVPLLFRNLVEPTATVHVIAKLRGPCGNNTATKRAPLIDQSSFSGKMKVLFEMLDKKESRSDERGGQQVEFVTYFGDGASKEPAPVILCCNGTTPGNQSAESYSDYDNSVFRDLATAAGTCACATTHAQKSTLTSGGAVPSEMNGRFTPITTPWSLGPETESTAPAGNTYRIHMDHDCDNCRSKVDMVKTRKSKWPSNKDFMIKVPYRIILKDDDDAKHSHTKHQRKQ